MKTKLTLLLALALGAAFFTGCSTTQTRYGKQEANFLGLIKVEEDAYTKTGPLNIGVKTSELLPRKSPSGTKVEFLWGLFSIEDK
ncbi:MAG: hypothetical protein CBD18_09215 [Opitutales bacterium TMED158]|nr:MAG: hypothetical protein CBD18_09215 [Opitutales bacterium TMED158]